MLLTRPSRSLVNLMAVALVVGVTSLPAAAQSGSEAVVCVGSERRTLATNPIRRVYTEDMEIVYRIGADIGQRAEVERDLSSELGSYPEVWCAWSDPGDDHAVIISYTGVIRQDLTVDSEDPRFQAFSVGFGTNFDAAETQATTINQRYSSYSDGSGFEVLLTETWGVAEGVVVGGSEREISLPEGPICTGGASSEGCWAEISNHPGCYLWNPLPREGFSANWSGECSDGFAEGRGEVGWQWSDSSSTDSGLLQGGQREGCHVINWSSGDRSEGFFMNGERHGNWRISFGDGSRGEGPYVSGDKHGIWSIFHEGRRDNVVREVGPSVNDERHGTWTVSFEGGGRGEGPYVNDELHGTWIYYDETGNEARRQRFENGRPVGGCSESAVDAGFGATPTPLQLPFPAARSSPRACVMRLRQQRAVSESTRRETAWK